MSSGRSARVTKRRQVSLMSVPGSNWAIRRTTSAAFTTALSLLNGIDPWPAVPRTRSSTQWVPFSPTIIGNLGPDLDGSGISNPPDSVST